MLCVVGDCGQVLKVVAPQDLPTGSRSGGSLCAPEQALLVDLVSDGDWPEEEDWMMTSTIDWRHMTMIFSQNLIGPPSAAITRVSRGMKSSHMSLMYSPESSPQALLAACCITSMLVYGSVPMRFTK